MAGTVTGGKAAAATNKQKYGEDFYGRIGAMGGKAGNTGGFASKLQCDGSCDLDHVLGLEHRKAQCAGYKGGQISRRTKSVR
jgi:hypothetical protein